MDKAKLARWPKLVMGFVTLLFAGVIYAWSITKTPFMIMDGTVVENASQLGLNYTFSIIFFCLGAFGTGFISKQTTPRLRLVLSGLLIFSSFLISSLLIVTLPYTKFYFLLYMAYGMLGGLGIGMAYVTVISTVNMWYPDKRGFASGIMMMGFGVSLLVIGSAVDALGNLETVGWRSTYVILSIVIGLIFIAAAVVVKPPPQGAVFTSSKPAKEDNSENEVREYTALEMIKRPSFILIFIYIMILAMSGSAAISFAKDIVIDVGATETFTVMAVGMLGLANGFGRIASGWLFDKLGIRQTQFISSATAILAPLTVVMAIAANSLVLGVLGLCLCGFSYGFAPTTSSVFASEFYGLRNFPLNFGIMTLILVPASFASTLAGAIKSATGGFMLAFIVLSVLTAIGFVVSLMIRKP